MSMHHYFTPGKTRLLVSFFLLFAWQLSVAQEANPGLTIRLPATTLDVALRLLEQQSKVPFSYEITGIRHIAIKACNYENTPLETILKEILADTKMTFRRKERNILIVPRQARTGTLSGFVEDVASGERLIGVSLAAPDHNAGTATNDFGFFSITLPADSLRLRVSSIGYQRVDTVISLHDDTRMVFRLSPDKRLLNEITVRATAERIQESSQMGRINLPASQIQAMPKFFGEADLLKTLQMLPGVKQGTEATSALLVRGGTPDQNLILLDGAPLYNPSHLLGVFSTFNTSVLKDVTLYKGAFPSRYGGRLSSVVDVATKDGNMKELHGDFSIGLLATQLTLEGPLKKDKTSFIISGRRTYPDLIAKPFIKDAEEGLEKFSVYFYDLNVKVHHKFSDNDKLFLSFYSGLDKLKIRTRTEDYYEPGKTYDISDLDVKWGNITSTLRWNHVFSKKLFSNTMLIGSRYRFSSGYYTEVAYEGERSIDNIQLNSGIEDYGVKTDLDYRPLPAHAIRMGAAYMFRTFTPGTIRQKQMQDGKVLIDSMSADRSMRGSEIDLYAEDDWTVNDRLKVNAGLHWSAFLVQGRFYNSLQPRLSARYLLLNDWAIKASYTRMTQYVHLLANNSVTLPTDLWVPATKRILPQQADQYSLGVARNVFQNKFEFSLEAYYKRMQNVIEYKEGADYLTSSRQESWQDKVTSGVGHAYGLEALLQKKTGRLTGWLGYTLAWANRILPDVNFGRSFPYKYDRRHDLHLVAVYKLRKGIELSGAWTFQSAAPVTIPVARYEGIHEPSTSDYHWLTPEVERISGRNNVRVEPYHRLDLGVNFIKYKRNGNIRTWNVSVLNAYNKMNPFFYEVDAYNSKNPSRTTLKGTAVMPCMPSFSYNLKF